MNNGDLDSFLERIESMTALEQREMLVRYFSALLEGMTPTAITGMRTHFLRRFAPGKEQDAIIEVIDGHLSLREIVRRD